MAGMPPKVKGILSKFQNPSGAEAKAIANFSPTTPAFVVTDAQRKKKAAAKKFSPRPVNINVVLLKNYVYLIPKGKARKKLINEGRIRNVAFTRDMSRESVKEKISSAFETSDYTILACDTLSQSLVKGEQDLDGEGVIGRRGCQYRLCENFKVQV